jgi:hypothetical protein
MAPARHGRRLGALLALVLLVSLVPVAAMAADPADAERAAEQALQDRRERMEEILARIRGEVKPDAGPARGGMAALDDDDLAFLGLRVGHGACAGMYEAASAQPGAMCTHGIDPAAPAALADILESCPWDTDCPAPSGWSRTSPPTKIPCYTTGPYVQVMYLYWGTGDFTNAKERIRRSVASIDQLFKISAAAVKNSSGTPGNRHVRWAMDASCKLKITSVKMSSSVSDGIFDVKDNLVSRGIITSSAKYLAFVDNDYCSGGVAEIFPNSSKSTTNPNNKGGSLALVYDCFDEFDPYAGFGATLGAHELMHTLGAVQYNAPHTTEGHCWDDLGEAHEGADIMCYDDWGVPSSKFYQRCTPTYPETFDCGKDDYFNPYPSSGSYLTSYWNSANNKFLATTEPTSWETVPKPTVKFTKPASSGAAIGGSTIATIGGGNVPGIPVAEVDWTIDGAAVDSDGGTATTLQKPTFKTRAGGWANGTLLTIGATITDEGGLKGTGSTKATVWNPYVRVTTPASFAETSGTTAWSVNATATGGRTVTKVDFLVNGVVKATDTTAPYGGTFTVPVPTDLYPGGDGESYIVAARVTDSAGVMRQTPQRTLYIPRVDLAWTSPSTGSRGWDQDVPLRVPASRTVPFGVRARASTPGGVARVEFLVNDAKVATDTTAPYTYDHVVSSTVGTTVKVTARMVDAGGLSITTWDPIYVKSVSSFGSQTASVSPNPAATSGDIDFTMVATPPSGGIVQSRCLVIDVNQYQGCLYDDSVDTITVAASSFGPGGHVAQWQINGNTAADFSGQSFDVDAGHSRFQVTSSDPSPTVALTGLTSGGRYKGKVTIGATVTGENPAQTVYEVRFYEGGRSLGADYSAPYSVTWNTAVGPDGPRTIAAEAVLSDGTVSTSTINVTAVNTAAALTAPTNGATVSGVTTLAGYGIYDMDTALESAAFLVDGVVVNTDRVLPFSYQWASTSVANGSHTIAMRVQLSDGRTMTTTPAITVTVAN